MADTTTDSTNLDGIGTAVGELFDELTSEETTLEQDLADDAEPIEPTEEVGETIEEEGAPVDPFADAQPLSYNVDKAQRTYDGILVAKDGRGVIPADKLADVQQRMSRHDHLESANKQLYQQTQAFERLGGVRALESAHVEHARKDAALAIMASYLDFDQPDKLVALAFAAQNGDKAEYDRLVQIMKDQTTIAQYKARESWGQKATQTASAETHQSQRAEITQQSITGSVQQHAAQFPSLTPADVQAAITHFARLGSAVVRPATPDEAPVAGVKPGELIVDHPVIYEWLKDRNDIRAEQARTASTSSTKATENARRLAAATTPKRPATTQRTRQPVPPQDEMTWQQQKDALLQGSYTGPELE